MGNVYFSIPKRITEKIHAFWPIDVFIETGTFKGQTALWAASLFKQVYTIEIDPEMSRQTAKRNKWPVNITFLTGNSKDVLPGLVEKLRVRLFFG